MEKRNKTTHLIPNIDRKASGANWAMYKNLISKPKTEKSNEGNISQTKKHPKSLKMHATSRHANSENENKRHNATKNKQENTLTKQIAIDCEMVGIGDGTESMVARVSIVNKYGDCMYDKYVKPREKVVDYRTPVSGIRPEQLLNGEEFSVVQKEVADMFKGRLLIGHALKHDLDVLYLSHPRRYLRDTSRYKPFRQLSKGNTPSLKKLTYELLGKQIQVGEHSSVEDARAAMQLYMMYRNKWESERKTR
ncbi:RNA exonuclease 4 isoform X2 [Harpegnathos saltator]|nr:RNA exonuclease 4 isoform X2 [Harpegnathos saltator]XP_011151067.1 RNA exonuclease 4 isoform X2 [Harpegnathos saltator]